MRIGLYLVAMFMTKHKANIASEKCDGSEIVYLKEIVPQNLYFNINTKKLEFIHSEGCSVCTGYFDEEEKLVVAYCDDTSEVNRLYVNNKLRES